VPEVIWADQLGIDLATLETERPSDWFQREIAMMHFRRAELFAEYRRLAAGDDTLPPVLQAHLGNIAFEQYSNMTRAVCELTGDQLPVGIVTRNADTKTRDAVTKNICDRCGFVWNRRQPKFVDGLCDSCIALSAKSLKARRKSCTPWTGRFALDDITPVDKFGAPYLPGPRLCRNRDCVNPKHIKRERNQNG